MHRLALTLVYLAATIPTISTAPAQAQAGGSDTAFVLSRPGIVPENLVWDAPRKRFLAGDLERDGLVELRRDGSIAPFAAGAGIDGRVLGLKIDAARGLLWGTAFTRLPSDVDTVQGPARSIVFALHLPDGRAARRVASPTDSASHLFNDLVIGRDGTVYFTDSEAGAVWALGPNTQKLRLLHQGPPARFAYPNGLAFLPNERGLLVAYWQGLLTIELPSGRVARVTAPSDTSVSRIDGLYPACGGYVGIQNMTDPSGIVAFRLKRGAAVSVRDLERGRPDFRGPTTGALVGDTLFYIANAQIGPFDPRRTGGTLAPVIVLRLPLDC